MSSAPFAGCGAAAKDPHGLFGSTSAFAMLFDGVKIMVPPAPVVWVDSLMPLTKKRDAVLFV